ncbi:MAG: DUF6686 family protein [Polaribacter sp.]|uniref:DUF6686 family protein n=1 Tax=Polaribacter sp. TaxID=1920175 RepID=UPI003267B2BF
MCENLKIISRVKNGELSVCKCCETYNLVYNNIFFQFNTNQLKQFKQYVSEIDLNYWLTFNSSTTQKRKIPVPTFHQNLLLVFNNYEIQEIRKLLGLNPNKTEKIIKTEDVDYTLILN